ncbi:MAG: multicopper oxidase domain-containing protein, partial [Sphaerospermopsis kisseleviana]
NIPSVTANNLPVRTMAVQYNYVFNRSGGQTVLNNPFWPADVSTLNPQFKDEKLVTNPPTSLARMLERGTYQPSLAPINFLKSPVGTQYFTAWWVGKLSVNNNRGIFQYMPSNLQQFTGNDGTVIPANPGLADDDRDLQYTINGQFQPVISTPPGQTEIWVIGNFSDAAYVRVRIVNTDTGEPVPLSIVGKDGNPVPNVLGAYEGNGTVFLIEPASRVALAVTMPLKGGLRLEMPAFEETGGKLPDPIENVGILYTNKGKRYSAVVGKITVDPAVVSYLDGFFYYPTQTLLTVEPAAGSGTTVDFPVGSPVGAYTSFVDLSGFKPTLDNQVTFTISGGFKNQNANTNDPNAFAYQFDGNQFPFIPIVQPRLNTTEQWKYLNYNNDQHPIHIHVNDYQTHRYFDPVANREILNVQAGEDNQNCPSPLYDTNSGYVLAPGVLSLRTEFQDFIGAYVFHCHRLNHEDNGLMAVINVIPEITAYAYAEVGLTNKSGVVTKPTEVVVVNQDTGTELGRVQPFGASVAAPVDVAMGDVNGDMVLDLIVGGGPGLQPVVKAYNGATGFVDLLFERVVFDAAFRGGVRVAAANIDGTQNGDNIIVGSGPGMRSSIVVLPSGVDQARTAPFFSQWSPFGSFSGGIDIDAGLVEETGRNGIVAVKGPGGDALVKVFTFTLFKHLEGHSSSGHQSVSHSGSTRSPDMETSFRAFSGGFRNGLRVATGWVAGLEGGFSRIVLGEATNGNRVAVYTSGSRLNGHPKMYITGDNINGHSHGGMFVKAGEFETIPGAKGVDVATAAHPKSADLVVSGSSGGRPLVTVYDVLRPSEKVDTLYPYVKYYKLPTTEVSAVGGR